ncbi:hypothetical protein ACH5RR_037751 [Cinchona calisaya]|uniref:Protein kinase domain-containing protein n=1 Tax=Cinchona calisaya TaxID=153742 RepID=A0ABD2YA52_9GENT
MCKLLDWPKRLNIIQGIVWGLLYLHQDSRVRITHKDLKIKRRVEGKSRRNEEKWRETTREEEERDLLLQMKIKKQKAMVESFSLRWIQEEEIAALLPWLQMEADDIRVGDGR